MTTFGEFVTANQIAMAASYADHNPNMPDSDNMDHWRCTFKFGRRKLTIYFSMGMGHNGAEPTADDVLACLVSDARGVDYARSFEDWCGDYGYNTDSRNAERTYKACERTSKNLKRFFAGEFDALLRCEEV